MISKRVSVGREAFMILASQLGGFQYQQFFNLHIMDGVGDAAYA